MRIIVKFGGTSVGNSQRIKNIAKSIKEIKKDNEVVIVVSALNGVTDSLIKIGENARTGHLDRVAIELEEIRKRHIKSIKEAISKLNIKKEVLEETNANIDYLEKILGGISTLGEMTPRSRDQVLSFGERLSTPIVSGALKDLKLVAKHFTGGEAGIVTDDMFGEANPLMSVSKLKITKTLEPLLSKGIIPVISGFIASTQRGDTTTFGRGGSDYTATILGAALSADEVWICTDVDGILTADPRIVKDARTIPQISYPEALEMTVFGAKAMHPRALEPAMEYKIPVRVKNTFNMTSQGTLISQRKSIAKGEIVKSVAAIRNVSLINIGGAGMVGRPGIAAKIFDILSRAGINILMISQSVSEANISMIVRKDYLEKAVNTLEISLLGKGVADQVNAEDDVGVVAVIGAGMSGTPGVAARVFKAIADKGINVRMIAQGSSELDISFVVKEDDCEDAVKTIHKEFNLSKR